MQGVGNIDKIRATYHRIGVRFCLYFPFPSLVEKIIFLQIFFQMER